MEKKISSPVFMGAIISLILIVVSVIGYITGIDQQSWFRWTSTLIFCAGVIYACINFGKQSNDNVTFGNAFAFGFKTSAVITCLMIVFTVIFLLIFPDIKEKALDVTRKQMEQKQGTTEEQIDATVAIVQKSFMVFAIGGVLVIYLVIGLLSSLIGAAITKKNPQSPFENQPQ